MIKVIFPLKLYLHVFQLEGYFPERLLSWVFKNFIVREVGGKKPLVWTLRARLLYLLALFITFVVPVVLWFITGNLVLALLALAVLVLQPYLQLVIPAFLIKPYLAYDTYRMISTTQSKLRGMPHIKVIGIAGSYGKTSVKEILYRILKTKYRVLTTPKSYNTIPGIYRVVDLELDSDYEFFICEMAAYKKGDIKELVGMVHPQYGILTGIAPQHLERFGSLENIIEGKFELVDGLLEDGFALLNGDSEYVVSNLTTNFPKVPYSTYGVDNKQAWIRATALKFGEFGSEFVINTSSGSNPSTHSVRSGQVKVKTQLLGKSSVQNILGASGMALHLGMSLQEVADAVVNLKPVPNRLELLDRNGLLIVNDSFNSNVVGFKEAVDTIKSFKRKYKVLVTPGIVELGEQTLEVHRELGRYAADVFTKVLLIGKSDRTRGLQEGLKEAKFKNVQVVMTFEEAMALLPKGVKNTVVLIENDLPDQY